MANVVVIFPADQLVAAVAYAAWTDAPERNPCHPDPFSYPQPRADAFGNWVVPYLGPPFAYDGAVMEEPEGGPTARAGGIVAAAPVWPAEPEA